MKKKKENKEIHDVVIEIQDTFNNDSLELLNDKDVVVENLTESEALDNGYQNN